MPEQENLQTLKEIAELVKNAEAKIAASREMIAVAKEAGLDYVEQERQLASLERQNTRWKAVLQNRGIM